MFDPVRSSLLDTFHGVEDAGVVAGIAVAAREENVACARRLEAMGELYARRAPEDDDERTGWLVDGFESLAAEVGAELGISRGRALGQLRYAIQLREKLPQLVAVFVSGAIDVRMVIQDRQPGGVDHRRGVDGPGGWCAGQGGRRDGCACRGPSLRSASTGGWSALTRRAGAARMSSPRNAMWMCSRFLGV